MTPGAIFLALRRRSPAPLPKVTAMVMIISCTVASTGSTIAQPTQAALSPNSFDVISVKKRPPNAPHRASQAGWTPGARFTAQNLSLEQLIEVAYGVPAERLLRGPEWIETEYYDIEAKVAIQGTPTDDARHALVQSLLADRFMLLVHHETKAVTGYSLTVGGSGLKLEPNNSDDAPSIKFGRDGLLNAHKVSMERLAHVLQSRLGGPVVDKTGLAGEFDFKFKYDWTPEESRAFAPGDPVSPPSVVKTIEQIGLKLTSVKVDGDMVVIDRAEHGSAN
jgi:uncharacterized protein (TIGR03435 family)